ncbi:MAG: hypothetical protein LC751_15555 [Actinobacteria bacterium]|nr:hypothetical protein [Actinomycetota bacterium]MCA1739257.1 hypothetical protein [Actinomycetota bacterium]
MLRSGLFPPLFILVTNIAQRDIFVSPGGALGVCSFVSSVLCCLLFNLVVPGMGYRVPQLVFSDSYVGDKSIIDKGAMICAAPTARVGTGISKGLFFAAVAHQGNCGWVPLVGPAKGGFVDLVVPFDPHGDPRH